VQKAIALYEGCGNADFAEKEFVELVAHFKELEFDFPTQMKQRILARWLRLIIAKIKEEDVADSDLIGDFVKAMNPFPAVVEEAMEDDSAPQEPTTRVHSDAFDPTAPSMCQLDGSLAERVTMARAVLIYDVMRALITSGGAMSTVCFRIASVMVASLEEAVEQIDEVPDTIEDLLLVTRSVVALLDVTALNVDVGTVTAISEMYRSSKTGPVADYAVFLHNNEYYRTLMDDFSKFANGAREGMIKVSALVKSMEVVENDLEQFVVRISAVLGEMVGLQANLRPGSTFKLERCVLDKFSAELKYLKALVNSGVCLDDHLMSQLVNVLGVAQAQWQETPVIQEFQEWATTERALKASRARWANLVAKISVLWKDDYRLTTDDVKALLDLLKPLEGEVSDKKKDEDLIEGFLKNLLDSMYTRVPQDTCCLVLLQPLAATLAPMEGCNILHRIAVLQELHYFDETARLHFEVADSVEERRLLDPKLTIFKVHLQKKASLTHLLAQENLACFDEKDHPAALLLADVNARINVESGLLVTAALESLQDKIDEAAPTSRGSVEGQWWHATLDEDADLAATLKVAGETLAKTDPMTLNNHEKAVKDAKAEYEQICGLCCVATDSEKLKVIDDLLNDLKLTWLEGLLVFAFSSDLKPVALKGKVQSLKKV
jgi:hypothetical protein